jgi:hypothetical protein
VFGLNALSELPSFDEPEPVAKPAEENLSLEDLPPAPPAGSNWIFLLCVLSRSVCENFRAQ